MPNYEIPGDVDINRGLVGYWSLDDKKHSGNVAIDRAYSHNHGTISGAINTEGINGLNPNAMLFNGTDDFVLIPHDAIQNGGSKFSFSGSIKRDDSDVQVFYMKGTNFNEAEFELLFSTSIRTRFNNVGNFLSNRSTGYIPPIGEWVNLVVTYDGDLVDKNIKMYVNGVLHSTQDQADGAITATSHDVSIGAYFDGSYSFGGSLSNFRQYNRVLTPGEASKISRLKL